MIEGYASLFTVSAVVVVVVAVVVVPAAVMAVTLVVTVVVAVLKVVLIVVVTRALVWAGGVIDTFVEVLTVDMRVEVLIIVSDVAVNLLMDAFTAMIRGVLNNIDVGMLVDVNVDVFADVMTAFEFIMSGPLEEFRC